MNPYFKILLKTLIGLLLGLFMLSMLALCSDPENGKTQPPGETPLAAPTEVKATQSGSSVVISWSAVSGATNYEVFRSNSATGAYSSLASVTSTNAMDTFPLNGDNYYKVKALKGTTTSDFSGYISIRYERTGGTTEGLYLGIIGFHDDISQTKPINLLRSYKPVSIDNTQNFISFVDGLKQDNNTALFYAVDEGINKLQTAIYPNNLEKIAIVTFTDGLDNISKRLDNAQKDPEIYRQFVNTRIKNEKVKDKPIIAYSIGVRASSIFDIKTFRENIENLSSGPGYNYIYNTDDENSMDSVDYAFSEIANSLLALLIKYRQCSISMMH